MLFNMICLVLDPLVWTKQNGFRHRRTAVQQVLARRHMIKDIQRKHLPAVMIFIDFKKIIDCFHRGKLMRIYDAYHIPGPVVRAISATYEDTTAKVLFHDRETEPLKY
jgi:hypothetical protein